MPAALQLLCELLRQKVLSMCVAEPCFARQRQMDLHCLNHLVVPDVQRSGFAGFLGPIQAEQSHGQSVGWAARLHQMIDLTQQCRMVFGEAG